MSYILWISLLNVEISYCLEVVYCLLQYESQVDDAFKEPVLGEGANNTPKHIKETILFSRVYWSQLECLEQMWLILRKFLSPFRKR